MKHILIILLVTFSFVPLKQVFGQTDNIVSNTITEALETVYSQDQIAGFSVAIVNKDRILYTRGFGYANIQTNKKYTENTIQNIASISKTFIGIALMKAQEMGQLNLDDPINKYLPFEIVNPYFPDKPITIRHLATHTSSIKDSPKYEKNGYVLKEKNNGNAKVNSNFRTPDEMMTQRLFLEKILSKEGDWYREKDFLNNEPGSIFEYSNIAAGVAALVLENATSVPFKTYIREHIFVPLEMVDTGWSFEEVDFTKHSILYYNMETPLAFYQLINYPDGGVITSSSDLAKYLSELIAGYSGHGSILSTESYQELFRAQLTDENYQERNEDVYNDEYNMGIFMGISAKGQIGHTGGDPGVATFMFFNTATNIGKILIVNTDLKKEGVQEFIDAWKVLEEYENQL